MKPRVHLCGIAYQLGSRCPIADLREEEQEEVLSLLAGKGVEAYSLFDAEPPIAAFVDSITLTLNEAAVAAEVVDSVLFVTESFTELFETAPLRGESRFRAGRNHLFDAVAAMGIRNTMFFSCTYGGSSNLLQALYVAQALLETGRATNLLLVCADRHPPGVSRFMDLAVAVTGDGVATCLLTCTPSSGVPAYAIEHVGITRYRPVECDRSKFGPIVLEMYRSTKSAAADCYETVGRQPSEFDWLILNNYNELTNKVFARLLGFTDDRTFLHNAPQTGHVPACDGLINLKDLSSYHTLRKGNTILLYANGPVSCGTISIQCLT